LEEKQKRIEQKLREFKEREKQREKEKLDWEKQKEELKKKKPLYQVLAEKDRIEMEKELRERKEKLKEIRNFYKPLDRSDFIQWENEVTQKMEDFANKYSIRRGRPNDWTYNKPAYQSKFHEQIAEEMDAIRKAKEEEMERRREYRRKIAEYQQEVKEKYLPVISNSEERESTIEREKKKKKEEDPFLAKKKGSEYLEFLKEQNRKRVNEISKHHSEKVLALDNKITTESMRSEQVVHKAKDYLKELRAAGLVKSDSNRIEKIIKSQSLSAKEKEILLKAENEKLEEKVRMMQKAKKIHTAVKEEKKKAGQKVDDDDDDDGLDDLYIKSIKAKLQILGERS